MTIVQNSDEELGDLFENNENSIHEAFATDIEEDSKLKIKVKSHLDNKSRSIAGPLPINSTNKVIE
jgi:hypothetical protein